MTRRHPNWLKVKLPSVDAYLKVKSQVAGSTNTVCEEAKCPNIGECWSAGVATFMILGDTCTRACKYCHVKTGWPKGVVDKLEPYKVAQIVKRLGMKYVVITSVDRDDLADGGASIFANTIIKVREIAGCSVEVLTPDYTGEALRVVIDAKPEVYSHNIESVRRVFKKVRSKGDYDKSLGILRQAKRINPKQKTKSAIMVGLGETKSEVRETMKDLRVHDVDYLAMGQYLRPGEWHVAVERYYTPAEFDEFAQVGKKMGFLHVEAGPLVRSSYRADRLMRLQ